MTPALVCLLASVGCEPTPTSFDRVVLIVVDTLRRDHLSLYSGAAETPAIDGLADRGAFGYVERVSYFSEISFPAFNISGVVPRPNEAWSSSLFNPFGGLSPVGSAFFENCATVQ